MRQFNCTCGNALFFESTQCVACARVVGFDPDSMELLSFNWSPQGELEAIPAGQFKYCKNYNDYSICNWLIPHESNDHYCRACELNEIIPQVTSPDRRLWWHNLEQAKRRLIYTLLKLKLPVYSKHRGRSDGLAFAFLEDRRMNPNIEQEIVTTGHADGLITIYLGEANDAARESERITMGESYRTLLGHFRHESGHYYFNRLIKGTTRHKDFKVLFGDDSADYALALQQYYEAPPPPASQTGFISDYAQSHPLEDWAECWAHYLHMVGTLETANAHGVTHMNPLTHPIDEWLREWPRVTLLLNELNRSMGLRDAYPFVLSAMVIAKLRFVHQTVYPNPPPS